MGNCGYINKKNLTEERVTKLLSEIMERRFFNLLKCEKNQWGWSVSFPVRDNGPANWQMEFWLQPDGLEFGHRGWLKPMWWLEWEIMNELAFALNAKITDDGLDEKVEPMKEKYPTFDDYIGRNKGRKSVYERIERMAYKMEKLSYPKEVKKVLSEIKKRSKKK